MQINLYPEMNCKIAGILRLNDEHKAGMYAAALIDQLQAENAELLQKTQQLEADLAAFRAERRWIPLSERMPTEQDADHLGFIIAHSDSMGQSTVCTWHHLLDDGVTTHWMPLPTPPTEQAARAHAETLENP